MITFRKASSSQEGEEGLVTDVGGQVGVNIITLFIICIHIDKNVGIEPLKVRYDVTKSHLIILLFSLLDIDIDLSIQPIFLTLYITLVH